MIERHHADFCGPCFCVCVSADLAAAAQTAAPAKIGEETFWLPTVVVGTFLNGKRKGKFTAHYSDYHRYAGSITILPGVKEVEPGEQPKVAAPPPPV